jgi:hypothetical protein
MRDKIRLVSFGPGGGLADGTYIDRDTQAPERFTLTIPGADPQAFLGRLPEATRGREWDGAIIVDKRRPLARRPALSGLSPMVDPRLQEGQQDRLRDAVTRPEDSLILQAFLQGSPTQRRLAGLALSSMRGTGDEPSPKDFVSPEDHAAWWKRRGARVGVLHAAPGEELCIKWAH